MRRHNTRRENSTCDIEDYINYDLILAAKFEVIPDETPDLVVKTIKENATTGEVGDGYVLVWDLD